MAGTIIENLSGRKLGILVGILMTCQLFCFLIGGLLAPAPSSVMPVLGTKCYDKEYSPRKWYYPRGEGKCDVISDFETDPIVPKKNIGANDIIFSFQIPLPKNKVQLDFSRWQQNLIGMMHLDIYYDKENEIAEDAVVTLEAKLGVRDKGDPPQKWVHYAHSTEERDLDCDIEEHLKRTDYMYNCSHVPLFELGSLHYDFYLLNIRLPVYKKEGQEEPVNSGLGRVKDMWVVFIHQNGGFTRVWISLKTTFFPIISCIMYWFWKRIGQLSRPPALLEYMLMWLGAALTILNCPLEYFTLAFDCPWMTVISDIRQGFFYASLLSFWLIFAGEHLMDDVERNRLRVYWRHMSAVLSGCLCLFIFDMCERGVQLRNPFYSIWVTDLGTNLALSFIILAGVCATFYFCFLSYMIWKVFVNISSKRRSLPAMSSARRMHYEGVIYRFKVLMLATLLCAAMTVIGFILGQVSEGKWKWDEDIELEYTSAFFTGVYGMWNVYIFALICLYAPSHKKWPKDENQRNSSTGEEIEFSRLAAEPSEMSSLTALAKKMSTD